MKTLWQQIFQYALGALIIVGFFWLLLSLVKSQVPVENKDVLNLIVGALIGAFATIVGYFYGSSKSSADKNDLLKNGK